MIRGETIFVLGARRDYSLNFRLSTKIQHKNPKFSNSEKDSLSKASAERNDL
jgi:hypothetical protein